ncbi:hypothetical protein G7046_g3278 [Stylonectria norvegica]|nr:hypothetical protein G7046_g3278 [Stylonectria norvegica]
MRSNTVLALLSTAFVGQVVGQNAEAVNDNPVGITYAGTLPEEPFFKEAALDGNVKGSISAVANEGGKGVKFTVNFSNFPKEGGPFLYHIHVDPVTEGNCTATLAHLDPYGRGELTPCDANAPESCQVGDLSGKHGMITTDPFTADYVDEYASTREGIGAFFGNRSFVVHYANKTRLTCASFELEASNSTYPRPSGTASKTTTGPTSTETFVKVNAAAANMLSIPMVLAGLALLGLALWARLLSATYIIERMDIDAASQAEDNAVNCLDSDDGPGRRPKEAVRRQNQVFPEAPEIDTSMEPLEVALLAITERLHSAISPPLAYLASKCRWGRLASQVTRYTTADPCQHLQVPGKALQILQVADILISLRRRADISPYRRPGESSKASTHGTTHGTWQGVTPAPASASASALWVLARDSLSGPPCTALWCLVCSCVVISAPVTNGPGPVEEGLDRG